MNFTEEKVRYSGITKIELYASIYGASRARQMGIAIWLFLKFPTVSASAAETTTLGVVDANFAAGNNSNPFLCAYKSYGINGIDSLVVGHFGEVNK